MTVTSEHVRELLAADSDAVLVLIGGHAEVVSGTEVGDDAHRGALEVISRADLLERTGGTTRLDDSELAAQAAALDTAVTELGG
ncbi:hypothetical protein ACXYX3_13895 [Mycobacterium sp. C3-094]|uniref:hypothetical protein n=1 Tax=Mycobacterium sp. PSTR-4-N TaxID=2917745 RepID=UPI001F1561F5|nr:hypothetical protein [Mycobacterium sp. PSTR-4-N]MCG7596431.1 hypothetical protein [Mycobacterium sp. PSTR-4-N]